MKRNIRFHIVERWLCFVVPMDFTWQGKFCANSGHEMKYSFRFMELESLSQRRKSGSSPEKNKTWPQGIKYMKIYKKYMRSWRLRDFM